MEIRKERQKVCFARSGDSTHSENRLDRFVSSCHQMRLLREEREQRRLLRLKQLGLRFETITLFKSWHRYLLCKRLQRKYALLRHWQLWRGCWLERRYSILLLLANQTKPLLRYALRLWWRQTLFLRAIWFYHRTLSRRLFELLRLLLQLSSRRLLEKCLLTWKLWVMLMKKLRRMVFLFLLFPARPLTLSRRSSSGSGRGWPSFTGRHSPSVSWTCLRSSKGSASGLWRRCSISSGASPRSSSTRGSWRLCRPDWRSSRLRSRSRLPHPLR
jgi:hypothetical protein